MQLPAVDYDLIRAEDAKNPANHLDLLQRQGERIAQTLFVSGNKVELLRNGAATYPAMLAAIRSARHRIDMESYMFDEKEGTRFATALLRQSKRGVQVNLIYDSWGSSDTPSEIFDELRDNGVNVLEYNPSDDPISFIDTTINHRDHRKLLIIDGKIAFTGGVNVSTVYKQKLKRVLNIDDIDDNEDVDIDKLPWRDTQVRIEGPVVGEFEKFFMATWKAQNGPPLSNPPPTPQEASGKLLVQAIDGTPDMNRYGIYRSLLLAIALAKSSVHLTAAYFVPTPALDQALKEAAQRNIDVTLILPSQSDSDLALKAGRAYYADLMKAGIKIYERQGVVLHAKTAVIDSEWSTVGSSNLDWRSVLFNDECNAIILGKEFGRQMETLFQDDIAQSRRIDPEAWADRSFGQAFDEWRARMMEYFL